MLSLEEEVFSLIAGAELGEAPFGLQEKCSQLRQLKRSLHALSTRRMFEEVRGGQNDPAKLWSLIRRFRVSSGQDVLPIDALVTHFQAVFNRASDPLPIVFCDHDFAEKDDLLDAPFVMSELETAVNSLDKKSAPGVTGIGNDVLCELFLLPRGPEFLLSLFNACLIGGQLPELWKRTEIFLLYKGKGDVADPNSYRGIALMESTLKLFEKLLFNRLLKWSSERDLIPDCQFGFRPRSGTLDAVFVIFTLIAKYVWVRGGCLFAALIDFQKAFPSVCRAQLLVKLEVLGVSSRFRRCIAAMFDGNTFTIRSGSKVTSAFPMTTGLREGSVLSPLLFSLFMSDIQESVLRPFGRGTREFVKKDPELNCVPVPGLLYADDLVFLCLTEDLLRERLRRLSAYADDNTLTVNVLKCEVVVFGSKRGHVFKYRGRPIPLRRACKYLGVWLDSDLMGKTLADALLSKFKAAVPVFFGLCRRLRLSRLDLIHRLANALVFSQLYGCEFLRRLDVIVQCEQIWWRGVRSFYGLPSGVSSAFLRLVFPSFSLVNRAISAKFGLLCRGTRSLPTLFPEAVVLDRAWLLEKHHKGYSQILRDWCEQLRLLDLFYLCDQSRFRAALAARRDQSLDSDWDMFSSMSSTRFAASIFCSRSALYLTVLESSRLSRLGARAVMLSISGALSLSYLRSRSCSFCGTRFDFEHFLSCRHLGVALEHRLSYAIFREDWRGAAVILLSRFQVFIHAIRAGEVTAEESELFNLVDDLCAQEEVHNEENLGDLFA